MRKIVNSMPTRTEVAFVIKKLKTAVETLALRAETLKLIAIHQPITVGEIWSIIQDHITGARTVPELTKYSILALSKHNKSPFKPKGYRYIYLIHMIQKILSSIEVLRWEEALNEIAPLCYQGFLKGRTSINTVMTLLRICQLRKGQGLPTILCLSDVAKCFPSLSRDIMMYCLELLGIPETIRDWVYISYKNTRIEMKVNTSSFLL